MSNPWEEISLDDYENHMSLDSVKQLQTMNIIMENQFEAYPVSTAMVLGVAGGNGLEHIRQDSTGPFMEWILMEITFGQFQNDMPICRIY
jgi:hypothetical protein